MNNREVGYINEEYNEELVWAVLLGLRTSHIVTKWGIIKACII